MAGQCIGRHSANKSRKMTMEQTQVDGGRLITVHGNSILPRYRHGDPLIVSDELPIALGDRIVIESRKHGVLDGTPLYRNTEGLTLLLAGRSRREVLIPPEHINFLGRIVWASQ